MPSPVRPVRPAVAALLLAAAAAAHPIKRVVVLMEENRSFDHMLGWLPKVNGVNASMYQRVNASDPASQKVHVRKGSKYVGTVDPDHSVDATTEKIYGAAGAAKEGAETMAGFVEYEVRHGHPVDGASELVSMFPPEQVPILSALAAEFCVFDRFFASVPGPTSPNRLFQIMGTALGLTDTIHVPDFHKFPSPQKTIFKQVAEAGLDWRFYFHDLPYEAVLSYDVVDALPTKVKPWEEFLADAAGGALPEFTWLNPRWLADPVLGTKANDQHPDHDVREGEALIKEVYEALRASPQWNETLLIVTYDEHGGFFDHVPPPTHRVPRPDAAPPTPPLAHPMQFDRLGLRVPFLLVSPWVQKGRVVSRSTAAGNPTPDSEFDHTSVLASVKKILNVTGGALTPREAWASTFEHYIDTPAPRTDCPERLPPVAGWEGATDAGRAASFAAEAARPLNHLQEEMTYGLWRLRGAAPPLRSAGLPPPTQGAAALWVRQVMAEIRGGEHVRRPH